MIASFNRSVCQLICFSDAVFLFFFDLERVFLPAYTAVKFMPVSFSYPPSANGPQLHKKVDGLYFEKSQEVQEVHDDYSSSGCSCFFESVLNNG